MYERPILFDADVNRCFSNALDFYGTESPEATITLQLQAVYARKKSDLYAKLEEICGASVELSTLLEAQSGPFLCPVEDPNEDHIRCICGLYRDEGVMIQCSDCKIWQHTECTGADTEAEHYLCEKCQPRDVNYEIALKETNEDGYLHYLSLMRGPDLQIRQSDTVYVLRDIPIDGGEPGKEKVSPVAKAAGGSGGEKLPTVRKHTYETIGKFDFNECDIFRVERMWKDHDGKRFIFGHHYLRPHETYHEPSRKFYQNEVVRVPLYEVVPIELIMGRCWVMDLNTFCKGRPVDCVESHVYICELRVDKAARLFSKISRNPYPVSTKSYAFRKFRQRLKVSRSYLVRHFCGFEGILRRVMLGNVRFSRTELRNSFLQPHKLEMPASKNATVPKKRRHPDDGNHPPAKKSSTPILQLMPPPQKVCARSLWLNDNCFYFFYFFFYYYYYYEDFGIH